MVLTGFREITLRAQKQLLFLALLCALSLIPTIGMVGILDPSDGFYSEAAREMLERNSFVAPTLNYEPFNEKPILVYWLICLSYKVFGVSEWSSRIPSAFCALLLCLTVFVFAYRFGNRRTAFIASLILFSSSLFSIAARVSLTDMPMTLFVTLAIFALFDFLCTRSTQMFVLAWVAVGLSLLTKGPIGLLIIFGTFLLFFASSGGTPKVQNVLRSFLELRPVSGMLIALAVSLPWYIVVSIETKGQFPYDFFILHNFARAAGQVVSIHAEPFWFYIPIFLVGCFPWSLFTPALAQQTHRWWKARASQSFRNRFRLLCTSQILIVFAGFSLLSGKLPTYVLPALPFFSIVLASQFESFIRMRKKSTAALWSVPVIIACSVGFAILMPKYLQANRDETILLWSLMLTYCLSFAAFALLSNRREGLRALTWAVSGSVLVSVVLVPLIVCQYYEYRTRLCNAFETGNCWWRKYS